MRAIGCWLPFPLIASFAFVRLSIRGLSPGLDTSLVMSDSGSDFGSDYGSDYGSD